MQSLEGSINAMEASEPTVLSSVNTDAVSDDAVDTDAVSDDDVDAVSDDVLIPAPKAVQILHDAPPEEIAWRG